MPHQRQPAASRAASAASTSPPLSKSTTPAMAAVIKAARAASSNDPAARDLKEARDTRLREIWLKYKKHPTQPLRNALMESYLHLVRYNAERIHVKLPDEVELDDLMSAGIFGLMDAIDAFDLDRGVKFETYCAPRIRGAILDELRSMDWVPRLVRSRAHKLETATKQLEVELGRSPTSEEIARRLRIPMAEFEKIAKDASAVGVVSLSRKWFETDSNKDVREIDVLEDKKGADPVREIQRKDLKELITKGLSRAERLIVILYYFEEMTMKEIGATLDLSESRVSQMHSSILARLKAQMQNKKKEFNEAAAV
jgi:RNA polymerase sigma factor for flagellar operon FliA